MRHLSITPSVTVTIGRHTRLFFAFVTTAPVELDSPGTMTATPVRRSACAISCCRRTRSTSGSRPARLFRSR